MVWSVLMIVLSSVCTTAYADVAFSDGRVHLEHITQPTLTVFCNKKQSTLLMDRVDFDASASAGWSTTLKPFTCAVFFTPPDSSFAFSCRQQSLETWGIVDCSENLLASSFPWGGMMRRGNLPRVSYWVVEQMASDDIPTVLRHQGFDV
ncbi:MAG: hypothetical protein LRY69_05560 [Gammaproteobacteria bacterium]|nr:hypothetical protein [Gammaproteobacteria bacterium]